MDRKTYVNNHCQTIEDTVFDCVAPPDSKLLAEGWQRRFIADATRAQEAVEMYNELGLEVRLEPIHAEELKDECSGCWLALSQFKMIYTRKKNFDSGKGEDHAHHH